MFHFGFPFYSQNYPNLCISSVRSLKISLCNFSCPAGFNINTWCMLLNIWLFHWFMSVEPLPCRWAEFQVMWQRLWGDEEDMFVSCLGAPEGAGTRDWVPFPGQAAVLEGCAKRGKEPGSVPQEQQPNGKRETCLKSLFAVSFYSRAKPK